MPTDLLSLDLRHPQAYSRLRPEITIVPLCRADRQALAAAYLVSYPPGVAATSEEEALHEIDITFAGEYGRLREDASTAVDVDGDVVGAVMVVERSIWDEGLDGPFIIDLFVSPAARGLGAGKALLLHAIRACHAAGDERLSLRFGEGTSAPAMAIYRSLGFQPIQF